MSTQSVNPYHNHVMPTRTKSRPTQRAEGQCTLSVSIPEELKEVLNEMAWNERRSVSNFLTRLLEREILQAGKKGAKGENSVTK